MADSPDLPPPPNPAPGPKSGAAPQRSAQRRSGLGAAVGTLGTLLVLGASVGLGWVAGMAIAQVFPSRNPEPPLTEVALRQGSFTWRKLRQLPRWWQEGDRPPAASQLDPGAAADAEPPEAVAPDAPVDDLPDDLPPEERDRLQNDLGDLQQDLTSLSTRLQTLESSLGSASVGTLEERLQRLDQRLDTAAAPDAATAPPAPANAEATPLVPYQEPRFALVSDRILLPSTVLFEPGSSRLTAAGQQLLDTIAPDLRRYGPVTLLVGSHTDPSAGAEDASALTLQQALAVQQYLAPQVDGVRWVSLGYGYTRPLTPGTTAAEQQRNQRVEIGVVPGP